MPKNDKSSGFFLRKKLIEERYKNDERYFLQEESLRLF